MKRSALALAALAAVSTAAQADIGYSNEHVDFALYGILDAGIGSLEHSYSGSSVFASTVNPYNLNSSPNSWTGLYTGGISMSRIGVKGEVNLDNGVKAFAKAEAAVNVTSGVLSNNGQSLYNDINGLKTANGASAVNGQLFSRVAYIGVAQTTLGSIQLGRTTNFSLDQVVQYDPVQAALLFSPLGFSGGIGGGLGATENTRLDNSVKYENRIGYVDFGLTAKFAGSKSDASAGSGFGAMLGFSNGPFSIKGTYLKTSNTVAWATQYSNVVAPDPNLQIENTTGYMFSALYKIDDQATIKAGYEYATIEAPSNPNLTRITDYYGMFLPNAAVNATGQQHFGTGWIGGDYRFTSAFDLAIGYFNINTDNSPEVNKEYRASAYSLLADYNLGKSFDTYVGVMVMDYSGIGLDKKLPTVIYSSNAMYGVGLRFKF
jgi:predicted porin